MDLHPVDQCSIQSQCTPIQDTSDRPTSETGAIQAVDSSRGLWIDRGDWIDPPPVGGQSVDSSIQARDWINLGGINPPSIGSIQGCGLLKRQSFSVQTHSQV
eukprot:816910-Prymnesium_polylepis.3